MKTVLLGLMCAIVGTGTATAQAPAKADRGTQKRTLILYTLRKDLPFTSALERVYQKTLSDGLAGRLDYYAEYIDVARFPEPGYQEALRDFLRRKYAEQRFDMIIASGNAAFEFVARRRAELFPSAPVVFSGYGDLHPIPNSTGLVFTIDMKSTLDLALRLQPETKRVFVICGTSEFEKYFENIAHRQFQEYEGRLAFNYLTRLPLEDLQGEVARAPEDSIIYFISLVEDGAGNRFIPLDALDKISSVANAPVYSWYDVTIDHGIVGGSLVSAEVVARQTAELALRALRGENLDQIPVVGIRPNINIFDWRQLRRWGISGDRLPPGSIVRFREPSFWDLYKWRIIGVVSLCMVEGLLIFALLAQQARRRRVEEALRDNEERLKLALGAANMGAWDWRLGANDLTWSEETRKIFGLANGRSAVTPEAFLDLIHPNDRSTVSQAITRAIDQGSPYDIEFRTVHEDGSMHWVMGKGKALLDKAGRPGRMLGVNMDITDRKRAEERLRSYFELPLIGMAITSPDRRFVEVNQKLCDILGYSMDQLTGMSWVDVTHPDDAAENVRLLDETLRGKTEGYAMDKRFIHRDGHIVYASISARCARRADRTVDYLALIVQEITERKQAEEALRESEERLRHALEAGRMGVWEWDTRTNVHKWSKEHYTVMGLMPFSVEPDYHTWADRVHPDDLPVVMKMISRAIEEKEEYRQEYRIIWPDGSVRWVEGRAKSVYDEGEQCLKVSGLIVDVTETKRAELNTQFINQLDFELSQITDADEIIRMATSRLGEYLGVSSCYLIEVNPAAGLAFVRESWGGWRNAGPSIVDEYRISDFVTPECLDEFEAGRATVVKDVMNDPRIRDFASKYQSLGVGAFISIPALNERQWEANLTVDHPQARDWRPDETQLTRDIAARLWPAYKRARAVEALRESEDRYRSMLESQTELICRHLPDTTLTFVNAPYCRYFGKTQEELIGTKFLDLIPEPAREVVRKHIESLVENPRVEIDEHEVLLPNGDMGWQQWIDHAILDAGGKVVEFQAVGRDITERKQMEDELRESEERLRLALEAGRMGVWEWDMETDALKWSKEHYTIMGLEPFSVGPKNYHTWAGRVYPDDLPVTTRAIRRAIEEKGEYCCEYRVIWPDGSVRWVEGRGKPIYGEGGQCLKVNGLIVDISERKEAEEALRLSEDKFSKAFRSSPDAIAIGRQADGMILEVNGRWEEILGYARHEAVGRTVWELQLYQNPGERARLISMVKEQGSARDFEVDIRKKSGEIRNVLISAEPIMIRDEPCLLLILQDITELKRAEEALRRNEEALRKSYARIEDLAGRLIASQEEERRHIARELHDDLNQQVAALAIGISRLKRQFPDAGAAVQEQIAKLRNKTDLLSERIRQVSHELHSSILQHVGLPAALNSYCAEFTDREGIAVALDVGDGIEGVSPETALCLYRVAQESLRNVARHSGARRAVVTLARVNGAVELRVVDQGVGFDPGQAQECRGLGLVSMEERVKLLHGSFVLTTRPGAGTELKAQIPLRWGHEQTKGIVS